MKNSLLLLLKKQNSFAMKKNRKLKKSSVDEKYRRSLLRERDKDQGVKRELLNHLKIPRDITTDPKSTGNTCERS